MPMSEASIKVRILRKDKRRSESVELDQSWSRTWVKDAGGSVSA